MKSEQKLKGGTVQIKDTRRKLLYCESDEVLKNNIVCRDLLVCEESHDQENTGKLNMLVRNKRYQS